MTLRDAQRKSRKAGWFFALVLPGSCLLVGTGFVVHTQIELHPVRRALVAARPIRSAAAPGELAVFEGSLAEVPEGERRRLPRNFALGLEEELRSTMRRAKWRTVAVYRTTFDVDVPHVGRIKVLWPLRRAPLDFVLGNRRMKSLPGNRARRAVGLYAGDGIACLGVVTVGGAAPEVDASDYGCFGGSLAEFRAFPAQYTERSLWGVAIMMGVTVAAVFAALAILLARDLWRARRLAKTDRVGL